MGVSKVVLARGNGVDKAKTGDAITMQYTGYLYDSSQYLYKGQQFDSSVGRGDFTVRVGMGQVIRGWETGILETDGGMTLGEKATLYVTSDYAYGSNGFPGLIPANQDLVFDIELKAINSRSG